MALPAWLTRHFGDDRYQRTIGRGLERAFDRAHEERLQLSDLRLVVFSDHHRGRGDGADDFKRCEHAYRAALGSYHERGYSLCLLGDVEELWENRPKHVIARYRAVLGLEAAFPRLWRIYGNHDGAWRRRRNVAKHLPEGARGGEVREAVKLRLMDGEDERGLLFLVHGHQGTLDSGNLLFVPISRFVVRNVWGRLQRSQRFASTSPVRNHDLRGKHDRAMFRWALDRARGDGERPVLIAGHTHKPVFLHEPPPDLKAAMHRRHRELEQARAATPPDPVAAARARGEYEAAVALAEREDPFDMPGGAGAPFCYFNSGCCSFGDGDVTGLELADGEVRLVRWLDDGGGAQAKVLASRGLEEVLASIHRPGVAA